jgi:hypothetical protein
MFNFYFTDIFIGFYWLAADYLARIYSGRSYAERDPTVILFIATTEITLRPTESPTQRLLKVKDNQPLSG